MKPGNEEVQAGRKYSQHDDGGNDRGILFMIPVVISAAEAVLILGCHSRPQLKQKKIPTPTRTTEPRMSSSGLTRNRPSLVRGFSGSASRLIMWPQRWSSGSSVRSLLRRSCMVTPSDCLLQLMLIAPESP